jgi:hypothetical protein
MPIGWAVIPRAFAPRSVCATKIALDGSGAWPERRPAELRVGAGGFDPGGVRAHPHHFPSVPRYDAMCQDPCDGEKREIGV